MARSDYLPEDLGTEVAAPSGYYQPLGEGFLDHQGRRLLYTLGTACIEASCCGGGGWDYLRVEGYLVDDAAVERAADTAAAQRGGQGAGRLLEVDTVEDTTERAAITGLLLEKHPGVRVEFR